MFSKYLTDANISDVLYMSKIVFFAIFLMCFHLAGVLGFWDYCSKWETRYRTIRSSLRSTSVYKIKVGWLRRITVKIPGLIRSSSCSISLFSSKDWLLRLKLSYLNDSCNKTLMTKTLESARNTSPWFLNQSKASSIKTSDPLNKSKVRVFMIYLNLWTHK